MARRRRLRAPDFHVPEERARPLRLRADEQVVVHVAVAQDAHRPARGRTEGNASFGAAVVRGGDRCWHAAVLVFWDFECRGQHEESVCCDGQPGARLPAESTTMTPVCLSSFASTSLMLSCSRHVSGLGVMTSRTFSS